MLPNDPDQDVADMHVAAAAAARDQVTRSRRSGFYFAGFNLIITGSTGKHRRVHVPLANNSFAASRHASRAWHLS